MPPKRTKVPLSFHIMFIGLGVLWITLGLAIAVMIGIWPFGIIVGAITGYTCFDFAKFAITFLYTVPKEDLENPK